MQKVHGQDCFVTLTLGYTVEILSKTVTECHIFPKLLAKKLPMKQNKWLLWLSNSFLMKQTVSLIGLWRLVGLLVVSFSSSFVLYALGYKNLKYRKGIKFNPINQCVQILLILFHKILFSS